MIDLIDKKLHYITEKPSLAIKTCASLMLLGGIYVSFSIPLVSILFIVLGLLPFVMYNYVDFKLYEGVYSEGYCIAGKTFGQERPYPGVEFLFLKKNRSTHITHGEVAKIVSQHIFFDGYINLCDGTKILVVQRRQKSQALKELGKIAQDLKTEVKDLTF
ncbi:hypothetical protein [Pontibacter arcticus]|nr:hypothetical protein [Pontibacter arcticus]